MKKYLAMVLALCMVCTTTATAFAFAENTNDNMRNEIIKLELSDDTEDLTVMKESNQGIITNYEIDQNGIQLSLHKETSKDEIVYVTGSGTVLINEINYTFTFNSAPLCEAKSNNKKLYDGVIETVLISEAEKKKAFIDLVSTDDFSQAVISLTVKESDGTQIFLLYGEPFAAQMALLENVNKNFEIALDTIKEKQINDSIEKDYVSTASASSGTYLQHVKNKSDSTLDGIERNKQMVVMSIGKYDPKNSGELNGMENIRVFSRAYNVTQFVDNGIQAIPYKVHASFSAKGNGSNPSFLEITATEPNRNSNTFQKVFQIFTTILSGIPEGQPVATMALIFESFISGSVTLSTNGQSYNSKVQFAHQVYKTTNLDYSAAVNLPSGTASSDAEKNKKNGVNFTIHYTQRSISNEDATATCSSSVDYRVLINGASRFVTVSSGTARITHTLKAK